jgi:FixJ family two-component response regulator
MSGLDLQRWMARARWSMPVVAISGGHDPHVEVQALRLGATAFLPKPFGSRALIDAITRAMSERHH